MPLKITSLNVSEKRLQGQGYIPTLDGWRAVAIVAVILSHTKPMLARIGLPPILILAADRGRFGVEIFFSISGFLICNRLLAERAEHGRIYLTGFYARRAFRILPLYLSYLLTLSILSLTVGLPFSAEELKSCLLFYRNYKPTSVSYTDHFWSLCVEEHFYLLWPPLLSLAGPSGAGRIVPVIAIAVTAWRECYLWQHSTAGGLLELLIRFRTDFRIDSLLWGCYAAILTFDSRRPSVPAWLPWVLLVGLGITILLKPPGLYLLLGLICPALIVSTSVSPDHILGRALEWSPIRWIGRLSYSLYVWHVLFTAEPADYSPRWLLVLRNSPPLEIAAIFASAIASHSLIESPMIFLGRRIIQRTTTAVAPAAYAAERDGRIHD